MLVSGSYPGGLTGGMRTRAVRNPKHFAKKKSVSWACLGAPGALLSGLLLHWSLWDVGIIS
jgi:hypothetical protein